MKVEVEYVGESGVVFDRPIRCTLKPKDVLFLTEGEWSVLKKDKRFIEVKKKTILKEEEEKK